MTNLPKKIFDTSNEAIKKIDELQDVVTKTERVIDSKIDPVRKGFLRRFPILFLLLVSFGVTSTFFGMEQILIQYDLLNDYPWIILGLGIGTLILTGTLYKKLS